MQMSSVKEMTCSRMRLASKCSASPLIVCCVILPGFFALLLPGKASVKSRASIKSTSFSDLAEKLNSDPLTSSWGDAALTAAAAGDASPQLALSSP